MITIHVSVGADIEEDAARRIESRLRQFALDLLHDYDPMIEEIEVDSGVEGVTRYSVVRYHENGWHEDHGTVIKTGLTLDEAQEHCSRDDSRGRDEDGKMWFDGYRKET